MNDGKEDIKGDLVETGKVATMYKDMTCEDVKELDERMERITNAFKDLETLGEMDK
jgi:tetrahydromethanopterin S-methyltransferase subunit B